MRFTPSFEFFSITSVTVLKHLEYIWYYIVFRFVIFIFLLMLICRNNLVNIFRMIHMCNKALFWSVTSFTMGSASLHKLWAWWSILFTIPSCLALGLFDESIEYFLYENLFAFLHRFQSTNGKNPSFSISIVYFIVEWRLFR